MRKAYLPVVVLLMILFASACGPAQTQPTSPPAPPATEVPRPEPTQPPASGGGQRADIPVMGDAANVVAATTGGVYGLTYQSASNLDTVIKFYETEMPKAGWSYDSGRTSIVAGTTAGLWFEKGGEEATLSLTAMGSGTVVVIEVEAGGGGGGAVVSPTQPPAGGGGGTSQRADIPVTGDAINVVAVTTGGVYALSYQSPSSLDTVIKFYETEMPKAGWSYDSGKTAIVAGMTAALFFEKGDDEARVSLTALTGGTLVAIEAKAGSGGGSSGGGGAVSPTQPPAGGGGGSGLCGELPLMGDATNVVAASTGGVYGCTYQSASSLDTVISFYETAMPNAGWSYDSGRTAIVVGVTAGLWFEKGGQTATMSLTAQGGGTVVVIEVD